ncbi:hypothetical protein HUA74_00040 [Myxococcus sp. CA051A]|uniref:Lipoprotein n=1 Tax=Myxococcus llanfairpwllgwyngyllgogerychwyrndrobwllllantysiliogogogochensis TaxID=2590453 RepID=A0A540X8L3_9BACT|nr:MULTISPECIES: hypothetical protein [Myxococcus]NTX00463.1 hypothetical protein [Myxococcus sp. CA040A]NTX17850.1 hypothetical protein [Myxococcus sp. CA056]NTX55500.1 hypothetical protein [Myxococcus sp. CA039A]NTX59044.1 hypothetical protein [Myxococcus sp. CA051A]TQF17633.1 hypothetical protein FJV41_02255 [Myxococcus llanfairpwllgwyngyllgogerychwyrndrobwllllantysiliogogogochensis]
MGRIFRASGVCLVVAALLTLVGCAGSLRQNYLRDKAADHVYRRPLPDFWPDVKALLKEQGYSWKEMPGRFVLETEWRDSGGGTLGPTSSSRFLVEGLTLNSGGAILRVMRGNRVAQNIGVGNVDQRIATGGSQRAQEEQAQARLDSTTSGVLPTQQNYARDLELELMLLQRIDPASAAKLEADAVSAHP